jgi:hypothetical protein
MAAAPLVTLDISPLRWMCDELIGTTSRWACDSPINRSIVFQALIPPPFTQFDNPISKITSLICSGFRRERLD